MGLRTAPGQVFGSTQTQRCRVHKTASVLAALPKRLHGDAETALAEIFDEVLVVGSCFVVLFPSGA